MNDFTASNGGTVETTDSGRMIVTDLTPFELSPDVTRTGQSSYLDPGQIVTVREFFRAEADERLGRWRWPENPDYVVYPKEHGLFEVLHEPTGLVLTSTASGNADFTDQHAQAARAYLAAHPEPKPWQQAEAGELWELTVEGVTRTYASIASTGQNDVYVRFFPTHEVNALTVGTRAPVISAGHRIFPGAAS